MHDNQLNNSTPALPPDLKLPENIIACHRYHVKKQEKLRLIAKINELNQKQFEQLSNVKDKQLQIKQMMQELKEMRSKVLPSSDLKFDMNGQLVN